VNFDSTPSHKILALHYLETRTAIEAKPWKNSPHFQYYYGILLDELGMVYSIRRIAPLMVNLEMIIIEECQFAIRRESR
jgi:hypothetical protein